LGSVARSEKEGRREAGTNVKTLSEKGRWAGVEQGRQAGGAGRQGNKFWETKKAAQHSTTQPKQQQQQYTSNRDDPYTIAAHFLLLD
jgi:hypothetical protein